MGDEGEQREVVVNFDYYGDSIVLVGDEEDDLAPGVHPGEARVEVDPLVEAFARSPYDPIIGSMMMGRATGEIIARPPRIGWMRMMTWLLAVGLVAQFPFWIYVLERGGGRGDRFLSVVLASPNLVVSLLFAAGGVLLLRRLTSDSGTG